jgi:hypothetical protein
LVIDEMGYLNLRPEQTNIFFKLMEERYRQRATIITTNLDYSEWANFLGNKGPGVAVRCRRPMASAFPSACSLATRPRGRDHAASDLDAQTPARLRLAIAQRRRKHYPLTATRTAAPPQRTTAQAASASQDGEAPECATHQLDGWSPAPGLRCHAPAVCRLAPPTSSALRRHSAGNGEQRGEVLELTDRIGQQCHGAIYRSPSWSK